MGVPSALQNNRTKSTKTNQNKDLFFSSSWQQASSEEESHHWCQIIIGDGKGEITTMPNMFQTKANTNVSYTISACLRSLSSSLLWTTASWREMMHLSFFVLRITWTYIKAHHSTDLMETNCKIPLSWAQGTNLGWRHRSGLVRMWVKQIKPHFQSEYIVMTNMIAWFVS